MSFKKNSHSVSASLVEGEDYYIDEQGRWVFTEKYHLKRGSCCKSGCRHCPYGFKKPAFPDDEDES